MCVLLFESKRVGIASLETAIELDKAGIPVLGLPWFQHRCPYERTLTELVFILVSMVVEFACGPHDEEKRYPLGTFLCWNLAECLSLLIMFAWICCLIVCIWLRVSVFGVDKQDIFKQNLENSMYCEELDSIFLKSEHKCRLRIPLRGAMI